MVKRPELRIATRRRSDNVKRRLADPCPSEPERREIAIRVRYEASPKHKLQPRAFGLTPMAGVSEDASYCDGHAGFAPCDWPQIEPMMRIGVMAGLIAEVEAGENPRMLWAVARNGWVYEARVTNAGQPSYHGYPLLPGDAMATKVVRRFEQWIHASDDDTLYACEELVRDQAVSAIRAAQERYRV